jgi:hypothetical protein
MQPTRLLTDLKAALEASLGQQLKYNRLCQFKTYHIKNNFFLCNAFIETLVN